MYQALEKFPVEVYEDDDNGDVVATCDVFPTICGIGDTSEEAIDDLRDEIADVLRNTVYH